MWRLQLVAAWVLVGCGGVVERGPGDAERGEAGAPSEPAPGPGSSIPPSTGSGADTELGACVLGYRETWQKPCAWVAESRCYETRTMACNCACPRDRDSQCASGFESGPEGHVWVACD